MTTQILVIVGVLLVSMLIGTPVAFSLGFTGCVAILAFMNSLQLAQIASIAYTQSTSINMLVIPLFVLMAEILAQGDIATDIFTVLNRRLRKLRGGLAVSATLASTIFAALCGSSPATAAAIGRISIREMTARRYDSAFAAGTVAAGGTLGIMIPPSIAFVTYGILTETSINKLLMAGLLPGLMMSLILCVSILIRARLRPALVGDTASAASGEEAESARDRKNDFLKVVPSLVLIVVVLGSMYLGIATATECAGIGCVGAFLIVLAQGRLSWKMFKNTLAGAMKTSTMIIFLVICGICLSYALSYLSIPQRLSGVIVDSGMSKWAVMIFVFILWFILGCLMDPSSMIVLTIPFIFPTLTAFGFDPIWIGVVSTLCIEIGMITPPVGLNLFVLKAVTDVPMTRIIKGVIPYVAILLVCLVILSIFPGISLLIPSQM
jgi:tripartite ATP-independent transporter DctM subunit